MDYAICDVLCGEESWKHEMMVGEGYWNLTFNRDGTGRMNASGGMGLGIIFVVDLRWRVLSETEQPKTIDVIKRLSKHTNMLTRQPELLGSLRLEIILERRKSDAESMLWNDSRYNGTLTDAALLPRQFTIVIERGDFMFEWYIGRSDSWTRYGLRMTFDVSPYPLIEGYHDRRRNGPDLAEIGEDLNKTRTYYANELPNSSRLVRATNDDSLMGYRLSNGFVAAAMHNLRTLVGWT